MGNINDNYFNGHYKDIWRAIIPPDLTRKEIEFMVQYFKLNQQSKVLDMMCGYGRHAIGLAEKGVQVTAIDNLSEYIEEIKLAAVNNSLPLQAIQGDISNYKTEEVFDLAICMGNSLNFFPEKEVKGILQNIAANLKPEGQLLVNSWSIAEIAIAEFKERSWSPVGDIKFIAESKYLFDPTRIETETIMISADGKSETKLAVDYIFSVAELKRIFDETGFVIKEIYSIPGRKKFTVGEPRAYIVAAKK
jgi:SAM-dependent methyltransferase